MKKTQKTKKDFLCLLFILPSLAGMCFFYIVPFLSTLYYSLINNMADKKWGKMVLFFLLTLLFSHPMLLFSRKAQENT